MNKVTDKEILEFAEKNLSFIRDSTGELQLSRVLGDVDTVDGGVRYVNGNVGTVVGSVRSVGGSVRSVVGSVRSDPDILVMFAVIFAVLTVMWA